jgi:hypothetical protein
MTTDALTFDGFGITLEQCGDSEDSYAVFCNGERVSGAVYSKTDVYFVAHRLLMRYGLSLRLLTGEKPKKRPAERHWDVELPNGERHELTGATERLVRELMRTRLGKKRLPRGTIITEVV